jgi:phage terminase large subunit-like protein
VTATAPVLPAIAEYEPGSFLLPATFTPALSENFVSDGPRLRAFVKLAWRTPENPDGITLDRWQAWLIDRVLERYPDDWPDPTKAGRLRYRQVVISLPRQNGKSVIGAILALYGILMHEPGPAVVSVASTADQARIVYNRVLFVIQSNPKLSRRFSKMTETRGIVTKDGAGTYQAKASKGDALQGIPVSLAIPDELHITKPAIWQSLVNGLLTRKDGLIVGITTAGDDDSELLKQLYDTGAKAVKEAAEGAAQRRLERFGFFVWQAPEPAVPEDDDALAEALLASNPALFEGRVDLANVISDVRATPDQDVIRYRFNLFVASQAAFIPVERWQRNRVEQWPAAPVRPTFAIDRSPDWGYATVTAAVKVADTTYTEVVASIVRPSLEQLAAICEQLMSWNPNTFVVDGYSLRDLGAELKLRGMPVHVATQSDMMTASSLTYAKIMQGKLKHTGDELLVRQIGRTVRKNIGDGFRISRAASSVEIDAVISMALAVFAAETQREVPLQIW